MLTGEIGDLICCCVQHFFHLQKECCFDFRCNPTKILVRLYPNVFYRCSIKSRSRQERRGITYKGLMFAHKYLLSPSTFMPKIFNWHNRKIQELKIGTMLSTSLPNLIWSYTVYIWIPKIWHKEKAEYFQPLIGIYGFVMAIYWEITPYSCVSNWIYGKLWQLLKYASNGFLVASL